jgi:hypothetical protein
MKIKTLLFPVLIFFIISCKKSSPANPQQTQDAYLTTTAGSTWNYHQVDSSAGNSDYTITSTSRDSVISGRTYHVYNVSSGGNQYLNITGNDYYQFDSLPAGLGAAVFERLYLKDNLSVGSSWIQSLTVTVSTISIPITLTYKIAEKGISRTVNGQSYSDVIHVSATISSSLIPAANLVTSINSYYAKKYGLIESSTIVNLNYLGNVANINVETKIVSATLL